MRHVDLIGVASGIFAMSTEYVPLVSDDVGLAEQVACVAVPSDQLQRALFTGSAEHVGILDWRGRG